jgi:C1A family cysteine protease
LPVEGKGLGWVPDLPDARDHLFAAPPSTLTSLPRHVDMRPDCPAIFDQGHLGSCTANAIAGAIEFDHIKQRLPPPHPFTPLRLFIYYNERVMEHSVDSDAGAQLRDGVKSVARLGTCPESAWPYDPSKFARKPPARCYKRAATYKAISYARVMQTLTQIKGCLAAGYPIVLGFSVYDRFMSDDVARTGAVPMPDLSEERVQGGHAVLAVGYDDSQQRFIMRNSVGRRLGTGRLLHYAVRVPDRSAVGVRLLADHAGGMTLALCSSQALRIRRASSRTTLAITLPGIMNLPLMMASSSGVRSSTCARSVHSQDASATRWVSENPRARPNGD